MARQIVDIGTTANDGTGDPLRTAMDKLNDNDAELYQARQVITYAHVRQAAGQSIASSTRTQMVFGTTDIDPSSMVSGNTFVIPSNLNIDFAVVTFSARASDGGSATTIVLEATKNSTSSAAADNEDTHGYSEKQAQASLKAHDFSYPFSVTDGDIIRFYFTPGTWNSSPATVYAAMSITCYGRREVP